MVEHAHQQRLLVESCNHNNAMDPLIGTLVVASAPVVHDGISTSMSTRGAKRQRCIEQEEDNQSNITFEGMDVFDDIDLMEADLHSRGSISAVHEFEVSAYGNHVMPPTASEPLPPLPVCSPASNNILPLGIAISLPVDDVLARMSPNTPTENALLDLYLILSKAGSPLYLFDEIVGFMEKHTGHTFQKGVTLPHHKTLIKQMQKNYNVFLQYPYQLYLRMTPRACPTIIVDAKNLSRYKPGPLNR
jgi:hypothetical protein